MSIIFRIKLSFLFASILFILTYQNTFAASPFTIGVAGDFGPYPNTSHKTFQKIGELKPNIFFTVGDFQYNTNPEAGWCRMVKDNINIGAGLPIGNSYGETYPFQLVTGDHESGNPTQDGHIDNYVACLPDRLGMTVGPYGRFGYGDYYVDFPPSNPNTRFIALAPYMAFSTVPQYTFARGDNHYNWAAQTIDDARARGIKWIIILNHHNWITMGDKSSNTRADFFNLMVEKKVNLIFEGNEHNYQRSKQLAISSACPNFNAWGYQTTTPANLGCVVDDGSDNNYTHGRGTVLVITGTGGIGNYPVRPSSARAPFFAKWMDSSVATYGYTQVSVTDQALNVSFVRSAGSNFSDSFTINDTGAGGPTASPTGTASPTASPTGTARPTATATATALPTGSGVCQKIIVPAYFYPNPTTVWDLGISGKPNTAIMIANPLNGPGSGGDSSYVNIISRARQNGVKPAGYVATGYTARGLSTIEADIDKWRTSYGITDIFLDEVTADAGHIPFYSTLYNYIKSKAADATIIINPGASVDEGYVNVADIISNFEGTFTSYQTARFPAWTLSYPASKFLHLIYNVPTSVDMQTILSLSKSRNAGYVYITNDNIPNPWDTLPPYWTTEVRSVCSGATPAPVAGDGNNDNKVDGLDYVIWLSHFNQTTSNASRDGDFNSDGKVDGLDYVTWLNHFGV